jgi:peptidoglycan/xylan/chitin deacetylase (PgdA/CDA1 family)
MPATIVKPTEASAEIPQSHLGVLLLPARCESLLAEREGFWISLRGFGRRNLTLGLGLTFIVLISSALSMQIFAFNQQAIGSQTTQANIDARTAMVSEQISALSGEQKQKSLYAFDTDRLEAQLDGIRKDFGKNRPGSRAELNDLSDRIARYRAYVQADAVTPMAYSGGTEVAVPMLIYHYPPANFGQQLQTLRDKGYTTVTLDAVSAAMHGVNQLPAKPVVITFDDGYASQWEAFKLLEQYSMKATFYINTSGPRSKWCLGVNRRYNDPMQPKTGCGDQMLNWQQLHEIEDSGLGTIAAHTVDHADLPSLSSEEQQVEIVESKQVLEAGMGHKIRHFAYPYGDFTGTTVQLAQEAGFDTAASTNPGLIQKSQDAFRLLRVRDATQLP